MITEIRIRPGMHGQVDVELVGREHVQVTGTPRDQAQMLFYGLKGIVEAIEEHYDRGAD